MTQILKDLLSPGVALHLHDLYSATGSDTKKKRHSCRGCLSTLQRQGLVESIGHCMWKGI